MTDCKWISVKDRLPVAGWACLTWNGWARCIDYYDCKKGDWENQILAKAINELEEITHWMPLPEPPEALK